MRLDKTPPNNIDAERSVLASLLMDNRRIDDSVEVLAPEDFYVNSYSLIYSAILKLHKGGKPVDLVTLTEQLTNDGKLEQAGGFTGVSGLAGVVSSAVNVGSYIDIVKNKARLRRLLDAVQAIGVEACQEPEKVDEFMDRVEGRIIELNADSFTNPVRGADDLVLDVQKRLEHLAQMDTDVTGLPSGLKDLDAITCGFQPSDLIILAARPSMGKTALALNIMSNCAIDHGKRVLFFSLEMSSSQLVTRVLCSLSGVNSYVLKTGRIPTESFSAWSYACNELSEAPVMIDDTAALGSMELRAKARRVYTQGGLDLVVVDYMQLMRGEKDNQESRQQEVSEISRGLKGLAKELDIPVLALSQLNRSPEQREGGEPRLSDLRESGSIEQDADIVLMLHRPGKYDDTIDDRKTKLKIEKHRNGATGVVDLLFDDKLTTFRDYSGDYDDGLIPG